MSYTSYTPDSNIRQYDVGNSSPYANSSVCSAEQERGSPLIIPSSSSRYFTSCRVQDDPTATSSQYFQHFAGQGILFAGSNHLSDRCFLRAPDLGSTPQFGSTEERSCSPESIDSYSWISSGTCPRISRFTGVSGRPGVHKLDSSSFSKRNYFWQVDVPDQTDLFRLPPSSHSWSTYLASTDNSSWQGGLVSGAGQFGHDLSHSSHLSSQSASLQSINSDLSDERPRQRRRFTPSMSISSGLSEAGRGVNTPPKTTLSTRSKREKLAKARSPDKVRTKQTQSIIPSDASSAFSTFSVNLAPTKDEPAGATYMSTVDFRADAEHQVFEHGPTDLPPRPYIGGADANSPWKPRKIFGSIPGSALDYLPIIEDRMTRLERAIDRYLEYRGERAVQNSILPGTESDTHENADGRSNEN